MSKLRVESWFSPGGGDRGGLAPSVSQLLSRAQAACERDEYALALLDLGGVLAQHPDFADVRNQAGFCRAMLGDPEGALEEFMAVLASTEGGLRQGGERRDGRAEH